MRTIIKYGAKNIKVQRMFFRELGRMPVLLSGHLLLALAA
jgi:hypothetical protein